MRTAHHELLVLALRHANGDQPFRYDPAQLGQPLQCPAPSAASCAWRKLLHPISISSAHPKTGAPAWLFLLFPPLLLLDPYCRRTQRIRIVRCPIVQRFTPEGQQLVVVGVAVMA